MSAFDLESMAGVFLGSLQFRWGSRAKSPQVVANKIDQLSISMRDMLAPMVATRQIFMDDIRDRFDREVDVDGIPWKKLNPDYAALKEEKFPGQTILKRENTLFDALMDISAYPIRRNDLMVNTSNFPPYWRIHDRGGEAGRGRIMPERSYLGMSEQAAFETIQVFDQWVDNELDIIMGPATGIAMERGALGRIKSRIGLGRPMARILPTGFDPGSSSLG